MKKSIKTLTTAAEAFDKLLSETNIAPVINPTPEDYFREWTSPSRDNFLFRDQHLVPKTVYLSGERICATISYYDAVALARAQLQSWKLSQGDTNINSSLNWVTGLMYREPDPVVMDYIENTLRKIPLRIIDRGGRSCIEYQLTLGDGAPPAPMAVRVAIEQAKERILGFNPTFNRNGLIRRQVYGEPVRTDAQIALKRHFMIHGAGKSVDELRSELGSIRASTAEVLANMDKHFPIKRRKV